MFNILSQLFLLVFLYHSFDLNSFSLIENFRCEGIKKHLGLSQESVIISQYVERTNNLIIDLKVKKVRDISVC